VQALTSGPFADFLRHVFGLASLTSISVLGLALAYSVANILQFTILIYLIKRKKNIPLSFRLLIKSFIKSFVASIFMAVGVYFINHTLPQKNLITLFINLALSSLSGIAIYIFATIVLKSPETFFIKKIYLPSDKL